MKWNSFDEIAGIVGIRIENNDGCLRSSHSINARILRTLEKSQKSNTLFEWTGYRALTLSMRSMAMEENKITNIQMEYTWNTARVNFLISPMQEEYRMAPEAEHQCATK